MTSKIKNIIIFTVVAAVLVLVYIFFIKPTPEQQNLISSSSSSSSSSSNTDTSTLDQNSLITKNFLSVLLSVKSIKLDDTIFSDAAFTKLHDSSISLTAPGVGDEGRSNPFAPIGSDTIVTPPTPPTTPTCILPQVFNILTNTCITPPVKKP